MYFSSGRIAKRMFSFLCPKRRNIESLFPLQTFQTYLMWARSLFLSTETEWNLLFNWYFGNGFTTILSVDMSYLNLLLNGLALCVLRVWVRWRRPPRSARRVGKKRWPRGESKFYMKVTVSL